MDISMQGIGMTSQRTRNRLIQQLREMGITSEVVLSAITKIPRHIFVDEALASRAYENVALPIGHDQTISQPYIVARMVEALFVSGGMNKIMEVGTGCGYQTAILSQLAERVYSIERIDALLKKAEKRLSCLGCDNVQIKYGDGNIGWPAQAPFDGIIVSAAPTGIPELLLKQLNIHGRLIIPVGIRGKQQLLRLTHTKHGFKEEKLDMVSFVPMLDGVVD